MRNPSRSPVNNEYYDELGVRWYTAKDDPVALLRAVSRIRDDWVVREIQKGLPHRPVRVLDVGCGAGFLSNRLARQGFDVTGIDASLQSIRLARQHDSTNSVNYAVGDAYGLAYPTGAFDVACAMDFLEHVVSPSRVVAEISRVLKPTGMFFFHTLNRNPLAWLIAIKGVEWFVRNTPRDLHAFRLLIKPAELREMCHECGLRVESLHGFAPKARRRAFWKLLRTGIVDDDFEFRFTKSTLIGYGGMAVRNS